MGSTAKATAMPIADRAKQAQIHRLILQPPY
jgi:hypothetical protein